MSQLRSQFPTAGHLAAYAGLAEVTRRSGTSIRGEFPARSGNKRLKRALFLSAFAALRSEPVSRAYYDRKRAQGKKHNAALICLSRRLTWLIVGWLGCLGAGCCWDCGGCVGWGAH